MNIINFRYNVQNFKGHFNNPINAKRKANMHENNDLNILTKAAISNLKERAQNEAVDNKPILSYFDIPSNNSQAMFIIKKSEKGNTLSVAVKPEQSDRVITRILKQGSKEQIVEYMENIDSKQMTQTIMEISNKAER